MISPGVLECSTERESCESELKKNNKMSAKRQLHSWCSWRPHAITRRSGELFSARPFILKTKHDSIRCLTAWKRIRAADGGVYGLAPAPPEGLRILMKSDRSFIKIQRWGLAVKKKKKKLRVWGWGENNPSLTLSLLQSSRETWRGVKHGTSQRWACSGLAPEVI